MMLRNLVRTLVLVGVLVPAVASARPTTPSPLEGPLVTVDQVVSMTKAGVSDAVIMALINRDRPIFIITTVQLVQLRKDGVSEYVIQSMLMTPYYWQVQVPYWPVPVAVSPPSPTRGIFFARPTRGIFFK